MESLYTQQTLPYAHAKQANTDIKFRANIQRYSH